ncbi:MAG TPA: crossover junction endodeoxyribonuclease RuvC [bacterium (Candidatus Stahlbacteria)]|nr:crossover junction endodeoxyribonuclease RuvC [Candidatus Stahlbacteria bacterium]
MRFLGIDPGLVRTGYAILNDKKIIDSGVITKEGDLIEKIHSITEGLRRIITTFKPDLVGVETTFYGKNPKTLIRSAQLIGAIFYLLKDEDLEIIQLQPTMVKKAITGQGRASKQQIAYMVKKILNINFTLQPDEADALAVALAIKFHYDRWDQRKDY